MSLDCGNLTHLLRLFSLMISFRSLLGIEHFAKLKEVILDNNFLNDATTFPRKAFPNIALLSLNNNKVRREGP